MLDFIVKINENVLGTENSMLKESFSSTFQCGEDFPQDSEWVGVTLKLQINTDE